MIILTLCGRAEIQLYAACSSSIVPSSVMSPAWMRTSPSGRLPVQSSLCVSEMHTIRTLLLSRLGFAAPASPMLKLYYDESLLEFEKLPLTTPARVRNMLPEAACKRLYIPPRGAWIDHSTCGGPCCHCAAAWQHALAEREAY